MSKLLDQALTYRTAHSLLVGTQSQAYISLQGMLQLTHGSRRRGTELRLHRAVFATSLVPSLPQPICGRHRITFYSQTLHACHFQQLDYTPLTPCLHSFTRQQMPRTRF